MPTRLILLITVGASLWAGQPGYAIDDPWAVATGNWNTAANWLNAEVPNRLNDQVPVINNAGIAQLSAAATSTIGGLTIGQLAGESGTLEISAGGSLTSTNAGAGVGTGAVTIGAAGTGTLRMTGGTFATRDFSVGQNTAGNILELSGSAALNVTGNVGLGGTTRINGTAAVFRATNFALRGTSLFAPTITSNTSFATVKTTTPSGVVTIQGSIQVAFSGVTPPVGSAWSLFEGGAVVGNFTNGANVPVTGVPALVPGEAYRTRVVNGGAFGKKIELVHDAVLVLQVNRDSGVTNIINPLNGGIAINSYSIHSNAGSLKPGTWNSLTDQATPNWQESTTSANNLAEFNPVTGGNFNFAGVPTKGIGTAYDDGAAFFTQGINGASNDLVFDYLTNAGELIRGQVAYTGVGKTNSLLVTINPTTGAATLKNDAPGSISLDGFSILSTGAALTPGGFTALPNLSSATPTSSALSQLANDPAIPLTLTAGQTFNLGNIFNTASPQTGVSLEFTSTGQNIVYNGVVRFQAGVTGDYDGDSDVDGNDILVVQRGLGTTYSAADLAAASNNFGSATAAVGAVPEPACLALTLTALAAGGATRRRRGAGAA